MGIDVIFPLTLTLSAGERGKQFDIFYLLQIGRAAGCYRFAKRLGTILPLLRGEGQAASFTIYPDLRNFIYGH
jgi:hypothetical protein